MIKIVQYFDEEQIRALAFTKRIYCLRQSKERGKMDLIQLCKLSPEAINKLVEDSSSMFISFEEEKE